MMQRLNRSIRIIQEEIKMHLNSQLTYRLQMISWVITDTITPLIFGFIWTIVARDGGYDVTQTTVVTYFLLIIIFSKALKDWSHEKLMGEVLSGEFSRYLVKPFNYILEFIGVNIAEKIIRIVIITPVLFFIYLLFSNYVDLSWSYLYIVLSFTAFLMASVLAFLIGHTFSLLAFFVKQLMSLRAFHNNLIIMMSGEIIPIFFLPVWARFITELLPYRYTLSFPVEILMGRLSLMEIRTGFIICIFWLISMFGIYKLLLKKAIRKYEAEGI